MPSSCQKSEPEHCERRTKRKRNQQELDFERQDNNAHVYTSLESTMPVQSTGVRDKIGIDSDMDVYTSLERTMPVQSTEVRDKIGVDSDMNVYTSLESTMPGQSTEVRDKIGVDSDMDEIIDDDPSPIIEAGLTPLNSKCLIIYVLIPF
jgi:hypothetical protein